MRYCAVAVLALLSAGCVHERPRVWYHCQATLTNEDGEFLADANEVRWRYDLGDGMQASLSVPHAWQSAEDFRARGFGQVMNEPGLVITFGDRFAHNDWMQQPPRLSVFGEIRIGDQAQREWVSNLHMTSFDYSEWSMLLADEGDMEVVLLEGADRSALQRGVIPRRALERLEPTLQHLSAEAAEMELDPANRCTAVEEERGVVIT